MITAPALPVGRCGPAARQTAQIDFFEPITWPSTVRWVTNQQPAADHHLVRGVLAGRSDQPDQPVALELNEDRRWWALTDTVTNRQLVGSAVQSSDAIGRWGNSIKWRDWVITLDADQDIALHGLVGATIRVRSTLGGDAARNLDAPALEPPIGSPALAPPIRSPAGALGESRDTTLGIANFVPVFSLLLGCVAVVGCLIAAASTVEECVSLSRCEETRPFLWPGIGLALAAALQAAFVAMIASYIKTRAIEMGPQ